MMVASFFIIIAMQYHIFYEKPERFFMFEGVCWYLFNYIYHKIKEIIHKISSSLAGQLGVLDLLFEKENLLLGHWFILLICLFLFLSRSCDFWHGLLLMENTLKLTFFQLEKHFRLFIEADRNSAQLAIVSVLLDLEQFKTGSVLDYPNVVRLLSRLTCAIYRMQAKILIFLNFSRMDDNGNVHIVSNAYLPQLAHEGVLEIKLFKPTFLIWKQELQRVDDNYIYIMLLNAENYRRKHLLNILRAIEVHEM